MLKKFLNSKFPSGRRRKENVFSHLCPPFQQIETLAFKIELEVEHQERKGREKKREKLVEEVEERDKKEIDKKKGSQEERKIESMSRK